MSLKPTRKTNKTEETLINWAELSLLLTGGKDRIRKNRIPKVHKERINELIKLIECWKAGKKLITEIELEEVLSEINVKTIILSKL